VLVLVLVTMLVLVLVLIPAFVSMLVYDACMYCVYIPRPRQQK
jgi:hypothetical protein